MPYFHYIKYGFLFTIVFQLSSNIGMASDSFSEEKDIFPIISNSSQKDKQEDESLEKDKKAFEDCQEEANRGKAKFQVKLGEFYEKGVGVEKNLSEAFFWYKKAADQNNMTAFSQVARCYLNGIGIEKNLIKAKEYCEAYDFMKEHNVEFNWDKQ